jgi:hypothetical protein
MKIADALIWCRSTMINHKKGAISAPRLGAPHLAKRLDGKGSCGIGSHDSIYVDDGYFILMDLATGMP